MSVNDDMSIATDMREAARSVGILEEDNEAKLLESQSVEVS